MANLLILTGAQQGQRLSLTGNRGVLGRDSQSCTLAIKLNMLGGDAAPSMLDRISRKHAIITLQDGKYFIEDGDGQGTKSRNGTFINEKQLPFPGRHQLRNNDRIRICDFVCTFHESADMPSLLDTMPRQPARKKEDDSDSSSVEAVVEETGSQVLQTQPAEKLRLILEISNGLSRTFDVDALFSQIVDDLFQLFKQADRCLIILWDEAKHEPVTRICKTRKSNSDPDARFSVSVVRQCLNNGQGILGNVGLGSPLGTGSINTLPIHSFMCAPLRSLDGQPLGAIQLDTKEPSKKFTQDDLSLLMGVASQAAIALTNARLYQASLTHQRRERDLEVAHQFQRALLPNEMPNISGYEFYSYYESALETGGDYFDFIPLPGQRLAVLLGDVAGKGVSAALVMVKFSVEARVCLLSEPDLTGALNSLNKVMNQLSTGDHFVTLAAVVLDPATHKAGVVNAGHPSPLLLRQATGAVEETAPPAVAGPPVGTFNDICYAACQIQFEPGDSLLMFSDGVTEAMDANDRQFRMKGVRKVFAGKSLSPRESGERLIDAVKRHAAGCNQNDDITLVCFGRAKG